MLSASATETFTVTGASPSGAGPNRAVSCTAAGRPGNVTPGGGPVRRIIPNKLAAGTADWSARVSVTSAAWSAPMAKGLAVGGLLRKPATGMACRTPGSPTTAAAWAADSGWLVSTRTSAPVLNAAWS